MAYDLAADVKIKRNRNLFFYPAGGVLQGELNTVEVRGNNKHLNAIGGFIPGHRVEIDTKNKKVRVVDRLKLKENAELKERIRDYMRSSDAFMRQTFGDDFRRENCVRDFERDLTGVPPNNLATWLFHLRRAVDLNKMVVVRGKLPSFAEIIENADNYILRGDRYGITEVNGDKTFDRIKPGDLSFLETIGGAA